MLLNQQSIMIMESIITCGLPVSLGGLENGANKNAFRMQSVKIWVGRCVVLCGPECPSAIHRTGPLPEDWQAKSEQISTPKKLDWPFGLPTV